MNELLHEVVIPIQLLSKNKLQGRSWYGKANCKKKYLSLLRYRKLGRKPFRFPVRLVVTRLLGLREKKWDYDNIGGGSWKQLQDSLVQFGWFKDDSTKWITKVDFEQDDSDRSQGPAVRIQVYST
jgi:hypothetical protein